MTQKVLVGYGTAFCCFLTDREYSFGDRVRMSPGNPGKSWKINAGPGKSWKSINSYNNVFFKNNFL